MVANNILSEAKFEPAKEYLLANETFLVNKGKFSILQKVIGPLHTRYSKGERSQELYDAIIALKLDI
jgi:hypothetical protein